MRPVATPYDRRKTRRDPNASGPGQSYEGRQRAGHPNRTFSLPQDAIDDLETLQAKLGGTLSGIVARAIRELKTREK